MSWIDPRSCALASGMAFGLGGRGAVRGGINVTPLVDIVLVLLIIFLVAMPIVLAKLDVEIPATGGSGPADPTPPLVVEVTAAGAILLDGKEVLRSDLATAVRERLAHRRRKVVFVDFAGETRYGDAVSIVDTVTGAGAQDVALKVAGRPLAPVP
jgi:biopolymer transport protein ExbD